MSRRPLVIVLTVGLGLLGAAFGSSTAVAGAAVSSPARLTAAAVAPGGPLGPAYDTKTSSSVSVSGAGANSINPFFEKVFYEYHLKNSKTSITYSPAGSSVGISDIEQGTVDFGDTEIPMSSKDLAKTTRAILQVPVDLGGVAISYNLPGVASLKLDGPTLAAIFQGKITNWDSSQIAAVSGDRKLPDLAIVPVHRADSSGPGWDLDDYLIKTAPAWAAKVGTKASKTWPLPKVGVGEQLNSGVATYVSQTHGAIGFVEYGYALEAKFTNAALKNKAGAFVAPSLHSIAQAGSEATGLSSTKFSIIDEPGAGTYPLANFSWTLLYKKGTNEAKSIALGKLFDWVVTTGQKYSSTLGYAPLPADVVALSTKTLDDLQTPEGGPLFST
ncbi:MAG: phosphate ABC transporter substrate-binding protein PstS [Acidimicrobiales bacterium]|jgi:phosphate transport system substrate-binding protein